jgi:hypothetical protein
MRADEPNVHDAVGIIDPSYGTILVAGYVEDDQSSLRMLPSSRFTSAGVAQSAARACRYQAIMGSRASPNGLRTRNAHLPVAAAFPPTAGFKNPRVVE